jgi:hypothetical protein
MIDKMHKIRIESLFINFVEHNVKDEVNANLPTKKT